MLTNEQIGQVKGYLALGHKQHDIAALFGVNGGRIADVAMGRIGKDVPPVKAQGLPALRTTPLFFTPSQTLDQQLVILEDLLKIKGVARPQLITPQLAAWILENRNGGNRRLGSAKIAEMVEQIQADNFRLTGSTIVFSNSGRLLDGQHRLVACVRADKPIRVYVVTGIDDAVFAMIDTGRLRSNMDAFHIAGIPKPEVTARATRWLIKFASGNPTNRDAISNHEALAFFQANVCRKTIAYCTSLAEEIEKSAKMNKAKIPAGCMAALLYLFMGQSRKDAETFAKLLVDKKKQGASVLKFIASVLLKNNGRIHEDSRNVAIIKAWNSFRSGKRMVSAQSLHWDCDRETYPDII